MRRIAFALALIFAAAQAGQWSIPQEEHFLLTARILNEAAVGKGLTGTEKAELTDGRVEHAAHIQTIDVYMPLFKGKDGSEEREFKDSWKFNVAAWRLAKLLRLTDMTPPSVARVVDGKPASVTWWIDNVMMDEKERLARGISPPDPAAWNEQMDAIRVFDQLIYNMDRSQENLLITRDWRAWMIDHTRAFRKWPMLRNAAAITKCNPALFAALRTLRRSDVARDLGPFLTTEEIDGLMARRDLIVKALAGRTSSSAELPARARATSAPARSSKSHR